MEYLYFHAKSLYFIFCLLESGLELLGSHLEVLNMGGCMAKEGDPLVDSWLETGGGCDLPCVCQPVHFSITCSWAVTTALSANNDHAIISTASRPGSYVVIMSFIDKNHIKLGCLVLLHHKNQVVIGALEDGTDPLVSVMKLHYPNASEEEEEVWACNGFQAPTYIPKHKMLPLAVEDGMDQGSSSA
jgi:hypothetical protein